MNHANYKKCELVNNNFPQVDFNVAYQTPRTLGNLFPFKDNIKRTEEKSLVVYKIACKTCDAEYIGKTKRILIHRIKEHKTSPKSACKQHSNANPDHHMDYDGIEILDKAETDFKLKIKELLHIIKRKPSLKKQLNSQSDFDIKTIIIQAYPQFRNKSTT